MCYVTTSFATTGSTTITAGNYQVQTMETAKSDNILQQCKGNPVPPQKKNFLLLSKGVEIFICIYSTTTKEKKIAQNIHSIATCYPI
jgi:hypothetical protein